MWVGPSSPFPAYLGLTMADGTIVDCAPGAVTTPEDLTNPQLTERGDPGGLELPPANSGLR